MCTCMVLHFKHDVGLYEAREGIGLVPISPISMQDQRKQPLRCFLIYGKTWENPHVGEGVSEGHKNCWNQKGWYAWSSQLLLHQCILCTASRFLSPGSIFYRWVHLKLFSFYVHVFFGISCSLCLFFPHAQWSKPPVDLFYIGDYTSPVIYIFYIAYD